MATSRIKTSGWRLCLAIAVAGIIAYAVSLRQENRRQATREAELTEQLRRATEERKEAIITRRVSAQMEEIAYQQKEISDSQRQEAINQTHIADRMRAHAEQERERAVAARQEAVEAYGQMEAQKRLAERSREEAVEARKRADTLALLALGRSLGSQAATRQATGDTALAELLSYSAWKFTAENRGDLYQPVIFDALSRASRLSRQWQSHKGAIRDIIDFKQGNDTYLLSAGQCGELLLWRVDAEGLHGGQTLIDDPRYDFRKVGRTADGGCAALSYTGQLLLVSPTRQITEWTLPLSDPIGMIIEGDRIVIAAKNGTVVWADKPNGSFHTLYKHPTPITLFQETAEGWTLGDRAGGLYRIDGEGTATRLQGDTRQPATAVLSDKRAAIRAVGYQNGRVIVSDPRNGKAQELVGHLSPITAIHLAHGKLLTSSYDGTIRLWSLDEGNRATSSIVYQPSEWIHTFVVGEGKERLFAGDERGNLSLVSISPEQMAAEIKRHLRRNFTREEWDYYIGELHAYERYL